MHRRTDTYNSINNLTIFFRYSRGISEKNQKKKPTKKKQKKKNQLKK